MYKKPSNIVVQALNQNTFKNFSASYYVCNLEGHLLSSMFLGNYDFQSLSNIYEFIVTHMEIIFNNEAISSSLVQHIQTFILHSYHIKRYILPINIAQKNIMSIFQAIGKILLYLEINDWKNYAINNFLDFINIAPDAFLTYYNFYLETYLESSYDTEINNLIVLLITKLIFILMSKFFFCVNVSQNIDLNYKYKICEKSLAFTKKSLEVINIFNKLQSFEYSSMQKYIHNFLILLIMDQDSRIRKTALRYLLNFHLDYHIELNPYTCKLFYITMNDDCEKIRNLSIVFLHQLATSHPDYLVNIKENALESIYKHFLKKFQFNILNMESHTKYQLDELPNKNTHNIMDSFLYLINEVFIKLCKVVINDISPEVRSLAVFLLAFPYSHQSSIMMVPGIVHLTKSFTSITEEIKDILFVNSDDLLTECNTKPKRKTLWPLINSDSNKFGLCEEDAYDILMQTLDKRILFSNMRRKKSYHDRAQQAYAEGESARHVSDPPLEKIDGEIAISADAGAFVHGLEDESSIVRLLTIESMCILAVKTADYRHSPDLLKGKEKADKITFAHKTIEYLVDMFNDEIMGVRLLAIEALGHILMLINLSGSLHNVDYINSQESGLVFRSDQIEMVLSALEEASEDIRKILRRIISNCRVKDLHSVALIIRYLLLNMVKYQQDFSSLCECFRDFAQHHSQLVLPLISDLLTLDSLYDARIHLLHNSTVIKTFLSSKDAISKIDTYLEDLNIMQQKQNNWHSNSTNNYIINFQFDSMEPDVTEDRNYIAILVLIINAVTCAHPENQRSFYRSFLPPYIMDRHYPYLKNTFPNLFLNHSLTNIQDCKSSHSNTQPSTHVTNIYIIQFLKDEIIEKFTKLTFNAKTEANYLSLLFVCNNLKNLANLDSTKNELGITLRFVQTCTDIIALLSQLENGIMIISYQIHHYYTTQKQRHKQSHKLYSYLQTLKGILLRLLYTFTGLTHNFIDVLKTFAFTLDILFSSLTQQPSNIKIMIKDNDLSIINATKLLDNNFPHVFDINYSNSYIHKINLVIRQELYRYIDILDHSSANNASTISNLQKYSFTCGIRQRQILNQISCKFIKPAESKEKEKAFCFIAGFSLRVSVEIHFAHCDESDIPFNRLKIMVKYPDQSVFLCQLSDPNFSLQVADNLIKLECCINITADKPWTDSAQIKLTPILSFHDEDYFNENLNETVHKVDTNNNFTYNLSIGAPINFYIHPKPIPGK